MIEICPLMSRPVVTTDADNNLTPGTYYADCLKDRCQLWVRVHTTENERMQCCALVMIDHKNQDGKYVA